MNMIRRLTLGVLLLVCASLNSPAYAQSTKDAYIDIKKKQFKKQFKYLAVSPLISPESIAMPDELKQVVSDAVLKKLGKAKIKVLNPEQVLAIHQQFAALYPNGLDDDNRDLIEEHTHRELFYQYPVDGLVSVQVMPVAAPFAKDKAEWGGTSQKIKHRGDGLFGALTGKGYAGSIAATAVRIVISNRQGKPVYRWEGGIEVMMQRNGKKLEALPVSDLWQKPKRVTKAIKYALKPI